jgi:hypothetical protein
MLGTPVSFERLSDTIENIPYSKVLVETHEDAYNTSRQTTVVCFVGRI